MASRRKSSNVSFIQSDIDCTAKCQLFQHAHTVLRIAALGNLDLLKHCITICGNPWNIKDEEGRTALHIASSFGHMESVEWLLKRRGGVKQTNAVDTESKWSSLHRAAYYGYPHVMIALLKAGASIDILDNDGLSPLNLLQINFSMADFYPAVSEVLLYMWGTNVNMTLGNDKCRSTPEVLETSSGNISQVVLCKFHTVLLTENGRVYSCGHGPGGRLGHGNENSIMSPKLIEDLKSEVCICVAAARNHSAFLTNSGLVYSCGINDAQQLGHNMKLGITLPTPTLIKSLKSKSIKLIGAGRYHTAVSTAMQVYSFGKNLGQLGYEKVSNNHQSSPKIIPHIVVDNGDTISHLSVSDAATACITSKRHQIFICINYTVLRCERYNFPESLSVEQFTVCASLGDLEHKKKTKNTNSSDNSDGNGMTIALLDSHHQLWFSQWTINSKKGTFSPQLIAGATKVSVAHFCLTKHLTVVTTHGEVYTGPLTSTVSLLSLSRLPLVQQVKKVFTDFKATNLAVLQNIYRPQVLPCIESSTFNDDVYHLLSEVNLPSSIADVVDTLFTANSLILGSRSNVLSTLFRCNDHPFSTNIIQSYVITNSHWHLTLNYSSPDIFQLFLLYVYGGQVVIQPQDYSPKSDPRAGSNQIQPNTSKSSLDTTSGDDTSTTTTDWNTLYDQLERSDHLPPLVDSENKQQNSPSKLSSSFNNSDSSLPIYVHKTSTWLEDINKLLILASCFEVSSLVAKLETILSSKNKPTLCSLSNQFIINKQSVPHDIILTTEERHEIFCHKCILVSRSGELLTYRSLTFKDYFQSMLLMGWKESTSEDNVTNLNLPIPRILLETVIDYLYKDNLPETKNVDFLTSLLIIADQFLLSRLKSICELYLAKCLNIKNIIEITEFASTYNASQLQQTCYQFISNNLLALIENGALNHLSTSTVKYLTQTYREMFACVTNRKISIREPTQNELPQSYFTNDVLSNDDDALDIQKTNGTNSITRSKSPLSGGGGLSTKKKKKRKSSISREDHNSKTRLTSNHVRCSPPVSPEEEHVLPLVNDSVYTIEPNDCITEFIETKDPIVDVIEHSQVPWNNTKQWSSSESSLRQIMKEEELMEKKQNSKTKTKKQNNSVPREIPKDNVVKSSWSGSLPNETSSNPWGRSSSGVQVSLRELMKAEEAKADERKKKSSLTLPPPVQRTLSYDECHPVFDSQHVVSFADIVSDQQKEMDQILRQQSEKKALHLIQIEETAIEQLLQLYNADNNPEEYIIIQRCSQEQTTVPKSPVTSPTTSVWTNKISFK